MRVHQTLTFLAGVCVVALYAGDVGSSARIHAAERHYGRLLAANVIIPQRRAFATSRPGSTGTVTIDRVDARVSIVEQVAMTTLDVSLSNPTDSASGSGSVLPVPDGAVVRGFDFQGAGAEPSAQLLPKNDARRMYDEIVARTRDPALLEFIDFHLIRSSVFPVEPHGTPEGPADLRTRLRSRRRPHRLRAARAASRSTTPCRGRSG